MDLQTITTLMLSADYKDRMKAEYYHLQNRKENLEAVLKLWDSGKLPFTPDCPRSIILNKSECSIAQDVVYFI